ncbi:c-type cytochrome [Sphingomonas bacterium]|uniref:c-type cytochrome n=1 Tax=Sphingomonas bacterium TaxID=1895847 RepID=UPI0015753234|nr:cytochrome c [Sphingomonas bacterium]
MARFSPRTLGLIGAILPLTGLTTAALAQFSGGYRYQTGQELYTHICQGCHMPDGKGASGAGKYPALAGDPKLRASLYPVLVILKGQKAMPSFSELTDVQIAAVTNYIRTNLGNNFTGPVTPEQVKALRSQAVQQKALSPG